MARFSLVIPTYNSVETIIPLLESLSVSCNLDVEVLVVDDGSTDGTADAVADFPVIYAAMPSNSGPAAARNRGAALSKGEWLIFADADTEFAPDTLRRIREALETSGGDALVGTYAGKPANAGLIPRYKALWEHCTIDQQIPVDQHGLAPYFTWAPRPGVVRRGAFEFVGGFDTRFRGADLEDLDLGYRLIEADYTIFFSERVQILHHYPQTLLAELIPFARRCALWMRMRRRWPKLDAAGEGSPATALAHLCGFLSTLSIPLGPLFPRFLFVTLGLLLVHWGLNQHFLRAAWREYGVGFAVACAGLTWLHSSVLGVAAAWGVATPSRLGK